MPEVVISEFMDPEAVSDLEREASVLYDATLHADPHRLASVVADALALVVRNETRVDHSLLDSAPRLRIVARLGVGLDNIDVAGCEARGIAVAPASGANAAAVAEYVIAAMLVLFRGVFGMTQTVAAGVWPREDGVGRELGGKRLGLVGLGATARQVGYRASALGMSVSAHDPYLDEDDGAWGSTERVDLSELTATSDAVSIHVPLLDATRHLVDSAVIASMKPGAVLINTARGGVVDEDAVVEALRAGRLAGAALDVFATEPLDPEAGTRFAGVPNLILTPHIAGITLESERRIGAMTVAAVRRALGAGS